MQGHQAVTARADDEHGDARAPGPGQGQEGRAGYDKGASADDAAEGDRPHVQPRQAAGQPAAVLSVHRAFSPGVLFHMGRMPSMLLIIPQMTANRKCQMRQWKG